MIDVFQLITTDYTLITLQQVVKSASRYIRMAFYWKNLRTRWNSIGNWLVIDKWTTLFIFILLITYAGRLLHMNYTSLRNVHGFSTTISWLVFCQRAPKISSFLFTSDFFQKQSTSRPNDGRTESSPDLNNKNVQQFLLRFFFEVVPKLNLVWRQFFNIELKKKQTRYYFGASKVSNKS